MRDYWPTQDWRTQSPADQGLNGESFTALRDHIQSQMPHLRSLLVVRDGYLIFEAYFQPSYGPDDLHELASAVKSFVSSLAGIAIKRGILMNLEQRLVDFFPQYFIPECDPRLQEIQLRHLLTMTSGLEIRSRRSADQAIQDGRWLEFLFKHRVAHNPGESFDYKPDSLTLSYILGKASGFSAAEFADRYLFKPLGIQNFVWTPDNWLEMRPRDIAKFALLYLNQGMWDGQQILPVDYLLQSTTKQNDGGFPEQRAYGYFWWLAETAGGPSFYAGGFGGQYIYIIPGLKAAVIATSNLDRPHLENRRLIEERIIPKLIL